MGKEHLDSRRTRIKSELLADGLVHHTDVISISGDVNYQQDNGEWEAIDPTIVESSDTDYGLRVLRAGMKIKFPATDDKPIIHHSKDKRDFSANFKGIAILNPNTMEYSLIAPLNPSPEMTYFDKTVMYMDVHNDIDLTYTHKGNRIKQEVAVPESWRSTLAGNDGDYLVIASEIMGEEIKLDDNVTYVDDYIIKSGVAFFGDRDIANDIPMESFHKAENGKVTLLIGIPLSIANDVIANSGILTLDPDTIGYPTALPTWMRAADATTYLTARNATTATQAVGSGNVGLGSSGIGGGPYQVDRTAFEVDLSAYTDGDYVVSDVDVQIKPDTLFTDPSPEIKCIKGAQADTITTADFNAYFNWSTSTPTVPTEWSGGVSSWTINVWNSIVLNAAGEAEFESKMNSSGAVKAFLIHTGDIAGNTPTAGNSLVYDITSTSVLQVIITYTQPAVQAPNSVTSLTATSFDDRVELDFTTPATDGTHDLATSYKVYSSNATNGTYSEITGGSLANGQAAETAHTITVVNTATSVADEVQDAALTDFSVTIPTNLATVSAADGVILTWTASTVVDGVTRYFRIAAVNDGGDSAQEPVSTGVSGELTDTINSSGYDLQRSDADSDAAYNTDITDESSGYKDTGAPIDWSVSAPTSGDASDDIVGQIDLTWTNGIITDGSGRYWRVRASSTAGVHSSYSSGERGFSTDTLNGVDIYEKTATDGSNLAEFNTNTAQTNPISFPTDTSADNLFDNAFSPNLGNDIWIIDRTVNALPQSAMVDMTLATFVNKMVFYNTTVGAFSTDWTIYGSNVANPTLATDGDWTSIGSFSGIITNTTETLDIALGVNYRHYKIKITGGIHADTTAMVEWQMYDTFQVLASNETSPYEDTGLADDLTKYYYLIQRTTSGGSSIETDAFSGSTPNVISGAVVNSLGLAQANSMLADIPGIVTQSVGLLQVNNGISSISVSVTNALDFTEANSNNLAIGGVVIQGMGLSQVDDAISNIPVGVTNNIGMLSTAVGDKGGEVFVFTTNGFNLTTTTSNAVALVLSAAVSFVLTGTASYSAVDYEKAVTNVIGFSESASAITNMMVSAINNYSLGVGVFESSDFELFVVNAVNLSQELNGFTEMQKSVANSLNLESVEIVTADKIASVLSQLTMDVLLSNSIEIAESLTNTITLLQENNALRETTANVSLDFQLTQSTSEGQVLIPVITITLTKRKTKFEV